MDPVRRSPMDSESEKFAIFWDNHCKAALCREGQAAEVYLNEKTADKPEADGLEHRADLAAFDRFFTGIRVLKERTPQMKLHHGSAHDWQRVARMSRARWGSYPVDEPDTQYITDPEQRSA